MNYTPRYKDKRCERCRNLFSPSQGKQLFCGSYKNKLGCSYKHYLDQGRKKRAKYRMEQPEKIREYNKLYSVRKRDKLNIYMQEWRKKKK